MAYNLSKPIHERVQTFCEGGSIYLGCLSTKTKVYLIGDDSEKEIQYFELVNGFHQTPQTPFHCKYSIFASKVCEETTSQALLFLLELESFFAYFDCMSNSSSSGLQG